MNDNSSPKAGKGEAGRKNTLHCLCTSMSGRFSGEC